MDAPQYFQFLDLRRLWPETDDDLERRAALVSQKFRNTPILGTLAEAAGVLSASIDRDHPLRPILASSIGVLQIALLGTAPFKDCAANEVLDLRQRLTPPLQSPRKVKWFYREQLIDQLTEALLGYNDILSRHEHHWFTRDYERWRAYHTLAEAVKEASQTRQWEALDEALRVFEQYLHQIEYPGFKPLYHAFRPYYVRLARELLTVFRQTRPRDYSDQASYFAVGEILRAFWPDETDNTANLIEYVRALTKVR